jgi:hypothetical protein
MFEFEFTVLDWSAYAAGLTSPQDWRDWAVGTPQLPTMDPQAVPALTEMPSMMRRRLAPLGRYACQVAWWCHQQPDLIPMVFASRYGDSERLLGLLGELVQGQALSPTAFGLSVHNAVSAQYGIARGHTGNSISVSAGRATVGAALTEAAALLADGAPEVLVVYYEAPLPTHYAGFQDEDLAEYAWCWRVGPAQPDKPRIKVCVGAPCAEESATHESTWPAGLSVLRHVLRQIADPAYAAPLLRLDRAGAQWSWSFHA